MKEIGYISLFAFDDSGCFIDPEEIYSSPEETEACRALAIIDSTANNPGSSLYQSVSFPSEPNKQELQELIHDFSQNLIGEVHVIRKVEPQVIMTYIGQKGNPGSPVGAPNDNQYVWKGKEVVGESLGYISVSSEKPFTTPCSRIFATPLQVEMYLAYMSFGMEDMKKFSNHFIAEVHFARKTNPLVMEVLLKKAIDDSKRQGIGIRDMMDKMKLDYNTKVNKPGGGGLGCLGMLLIFLIGFVVVGAFTFFFVR